MDSFTRPNIGTEGCATCGRYDGSEVMKIPALGLAIPWLDVWCAGAALVYVVQMSASTVKNLCGLSSPRHAVTDGIKIWFCYSTTTSNLARRKGETALHNAWVCNVAHTRRKNRTQVVESRIGAMQGARWPPPRIVTAKCSWPGRTWQKDQRWCRDTYYTV